MPDRDVQEFRAAPLRITTESRRTADDEGLTIRVFGTVGDRERQVLRFDCFQNDPHYHYDPDERDEQHHMRDESIDDPMEWTLHRLERSLAEMIRRAGYGTLADQVDTAAVARLLPVIREALSVSVA
jgi:hypothetical protein